jgi:glycosyltransferase involved in cell wall biosynthesis
MYNGHTVAVVVPSYNEEAFVGGVLDTVPSFVDRIYAVDDCSTDSTWGEILRHARRADGVAHEGSVPEDSVGPNTSSSEVDSLTSRGGDDERGTIADGSTNATPITPIRHDRNRGVGAAITTGYERSLEDGMDITAVMAGDGQMDPDRLERLIDPIADGRVDYAKGNRLARPEDYEEMCRWRLFGNLVLSSLTKVASGYWGMMDPQNGYTAISREALEQLDLERTYQGYGFANDLLIELNTCGFRIADVSLPAVYGDEESHIQYWTFVPGLLTVLVRGFVRRLGRKHHDRLLALVYALSAGMCFLVLSALTGVLHTWNQADEGRIAGSVVLLAVSGTAVLLATAFARDANEEMVVTLR